MPTTGDRAYHVSLYIRYLQHNTFPCTSIRDKVSVARTLERSNVYDKHAVVDIAKSLRAGNDLTAQLFNLYGRVTR